VNHVGFSERNNVGLMLFTRGVNAK